MIKKYITIMSLLTLTACASSFPSQMMDPIEASVEPEIITQSVYKKLEDLPPVDGPPITVAVYSFSDKTGQRKPNDKFSTFSSAVTQGSEVFLISALQEAGNGKWFQVLERVGLDNLIKERQLIRSQRETYEGKDAKQLQPMLVAGIMIEGGVIGYDTDVSSGGIGARFLGIGADQQYRTDLVTVVIRLVSVSTGEVLVSSGASKTVYSTGVNGGVLKFIDAGTKAIEFEAGNNINEPTTYTVRLAIEAAVVDLIDQGVQKGLWQYQEVKVNAN